ncbi:CoA ester lyase [Mesorhizobium sp. M0522]|uniref:HpcH/HpaI aldolase/citrate lyase family protein n=1 Tax=Mesorhizobium sp. M0522 TaxID=2956958 RepID=UPI00333B1ED0
MVDISLLRLPLFVPADRPERFEKAAASGADSVILDLEDAVAAANKAAARGALRTDFTQLPVLVRINAHSTSWHDDDVATVSKLPIAAVILPNADLPDVIESVSSKVGAPIIPLIESARGFANARSIAAASGVVRLAFGSIDFCADLGCEHLRDVLLPIRLELVLASRLAGISGPIDGVTVQLDDLAVSRDDALHARSIGMTGKLCIHPKQVAAVRSGFAPSKREKDWARRVLASGDGAISVDGNMVDEPVRIRARAILALAL